jgi:NAD+ synthase
MEQIHLISLPERDSSTAPQNHARMTARSLNLPLEEKNLSDLIGQLGIYEQVPLQQVGSRKKYERAFRILRFLSGAPSFYPWAQEYAFHHRKGLPGWLLRKWLWTYGARSEIFIFGKVRTRMIKLSLKAMQLDCLLICTTDRSEWSIGFYDPHGDGVGDIAPLRHLYKTQIRQLAYALGVPEEIIRQPSSGDLAAGLPNETAMGISYDQLDHILAGISLDMTDEDIAMGANVTKSMVRAIRGACKLADLRRQFPLGLDSSPLI